MNKSEKEIQIEKLESIIKNIKRYRISKSNAHEILRTLSTFNHTFSKEFSLIADSCNENSDGEIHISDGISDLENYAYSKLKVKDDKYFYSGIKQVTKGLEYLLYELNQISD